MKLKITDVREVIGELIAETWSSHDVYRRWKNPTAEERVRIEREMGMPLRWDALMMGIQDSFTEKWMMTRYGRIEPMIYYAVGVSVKDIHSTLDEGYGICTVAIAYDSSFGKPSEYWVAGYGPEPDMKDLEHAFLNKMSHGSHGPVIGSERLDDHLRHDGFHAYTSEIIYKCILTEAQKFKMHIKLGPNSGVGSTFIIRFDNQENMTYALRKAEPNIKAWIHKDYPNRMIRIKANATHSDVDISILIYNKYTNQMIGIVNYINLTIEVSKTNDKT